MSGTALNLLLLATHLEHGPLGHDRFDVRQVSSGDRKANGCGEVGDAIGECVVVFPDCFEFIPLGPSERWYGVRLKGTQWTNAAACAQFFGITFATSMALFYPGEQHNYDGLPVLESDAGPLHVAAIIRQYLHLETRQH